MILIPMEEMVTELEGRNFDELDPLTAQMVKDREARRAAVYGVAKGQTQVSDWKQK